MTYHFICIDNFQKQIKNGFDGTDGVCKLEFVLWRGGSAMYCKDFVTLHSSSDCVRPCQLILEHTVFAALPYRQRQVQPYAAGHAVKRGSEGKNS